MEYSITRLPKHQRSYNEKENSCRATFEMVLRGGGSFWHVCTPGTYQYIVFETPEDFDYGIISAATASHDTGVEIITFELMSNHVHFILIARSAEEAKAFLALFRSRMALYFRLKVNPKNLNGFSSDPIPIESLDSLRNQIAYTNRNNFVIDPDQTPFSYPYGANAFYFNPFAKNVKGCRFDGLSDRAKIRLIHSKRIDYPGSWIVTGDGILPSSFCKISLGERFFRDARHYMYKITRDLESYKELSGILGDLDYYTDDELVGIVYSICRKKFGRERPSLLTPDQKNELARTLHFEYRSDNAKITRLLHIPLSTVEALFPAP